MTQPWPTPSVTEPVRATVPVPGSKSITNRALLLAALADGPSTVHLPLRSRDTQLMAGGAALAGRARRRTATRAPGRSRRGPLRGGADLDCGLAGTVMRFVPPAAALADGDVRFDGDEQARVRPMNTVLDALRSLGVDDRRRLAAVRPARHGLGARRRASRSTRPAPRSSSPALLLSGARYEQGVTVLHDGKPVPSLPHIEMTVEMLRAVGRRGGRQRAQPLARRAGRRSRPATGGSSRTCPTRPRSSPPAPSPAAPITVPDWPLATTQPGDAIRDILAQMGCGVSLSDNGLTVTGPAAPQRHRHRPARRLRADADRRGAGGAGRQPDPASAASRTSAATRPTGSPR